MYGRTPMDELVQVGLGIGSCSYQKTEFRRFCEMKYLLEKETHNKNEDNTMKELNEIFLMVYGLPK
jgi:hypothetical protein